VVSQCFSEPTYALPSTTRPQLVPVTTRYSSDRGSRYPLLASVARFVLAIPATSVSSERLFSTAGLVVDRLLASMAPDMVQKICCLTNLLRNKIVCTIPS